MYAEIATAPTHSGTDYPQSANLSNKSYRINFDFRKTMDRIVGIATLELSDTRLAAVEYGSSTSEIFKNLMEKLKVQMIDMNIENVSMTHSFH